jgi:homoserine kinase type II
MAVYTDVSDEELDAFIASYAIGELTSFKGIAEGVENSNFLLNTEQAQFILTLYEKRVHREDLPFFLGLMEHLAARGLSCPTPVHDRTGAVLQELAGRPAAIISFLNGYSVRRPRVPHCGPVGEALADMHLAGADFPLTRANALSLAGWRQLADATADKADRLAHGLAGEIAAELRFLEASWPDDLPAGVIHADLFPDNVFFRGETMSGLIDFYFACNDLLAYDLAICLNAWCFEEPNAINVTKARALLRGYGARRPLSEAEIRALPILARGAALRFLLTRLYDWFNTSESALVRPKDPLEYRRKLRFHQSVRSPGDYGV